MVGSIAGRHAPSADAVEGVAVRSGGVPLFIEEVTRLILEGGARDIALTGAVGGRDCLDKFGISTSDCMCRIDCTS